MLKQLAKFPLIKHLPLQRLHSAGVEGLLILLLSNILIVASLGVSWFYFIYLVARMAMVSPASVEPDKWIMIMGLRLKSNQPEYDYIVRMKRAMLLHEKFPHTRILAMGGKTGGNTVTEAEEARKFFIAHRIDESKILTEEESIHTLENLQFARALIKDEHAGLMVLVSNRYHLARCHAMASFMGLPHVLCAAEEKLDFGLRSIFLIIKEAYHLHWYKTGQWWALLTNNRKTLARIQ